jgi:NAD(P)H-hydrate repair Nnr-like enzyme with NAD(P)H-hydrate dehydratase domain
VLTGVIGGLMCGGREGGKTAFEAAVSGAYICGKAGEAAARDMGELSMTAMDTLAHIAEVTKQMMG